MKFGTASAAPPLSRNERSKRPSALSKMPQRGNFFGPAVTRTRFVVACRAIPDENCQARLRWHRRPGHRLRHSRRGNAEARLSRRDARPPGPGPAATPQDKQDSTNRSVENVSVQTAHRQPHRDSHGAVRNLAGRVCGAWKVPQGGLLTRPGELLLTPSTPRNIVIRSLSSSRPTMVTAMLSRARDSLSG